MSEQEEYMETKRSGTFLMDQCGSTAKFQGCLRVTPPTHSRGDITQHYCFIGGMAFPVAKSRGTPTPFTPSVEAPMQILWSWFNRRCPFTLAVAFKTCYEGWEIAQWDDDIDYIVYLPNAEITDEGFMTNLTQGMDDTSEPVMATVTLHCGQWELFEKHTPGKIAGIPDALTDNVLALAYCGGPLCASLSNVCNQPYDAGCNHFWVGGESGLLYLVTNGGNTWTDKSGSGAGQLDLADAVYGQMDVQAIYCDRDVVLVSAEDGCIYYSHDGGTTWNTPDDCSQNAVSFAGYFKNIFAAGNGLWYSTDDGINWTRLLAGAFQDVYITPNGYGVAITSDAIYFSTDGGMSWTELTASGLSAQTSVQKVNGTIWVAGGDGMAYTYDQGQNWTIIDTHPWNDILFLTCLVGYRIAGTNGSTSTIQYTLDGGATWWDLPITGHDAESLNVLAACYDRILIGGDSGFIAQMVTKKRMVE